MNSAWYIRRFGWVPRPVRQIIILVIGGTVLLIGIVMIVAPGPAIVVVPLGLAILALEFAFAARWLSKIKSGANNFHAFMKSGLRLSKVKPAEDSKLEINAETDDAGPDVVDRESTSQNE